MVGTGGLAAALIVGLARCAVAEEDAVHCSQHNVFKENPDYHGDGKGQTPYHYDEAFIGSCERIGIEDIGEEDIGEEGLLALAKALGTNTAVVSLKVSGLRVTDAAAAAIATALSSGFSAVTELDLGGCRIETEGAIALARMLAVNPSLRSFGFANNYAKDEGVEAIGAALAANPWLEHLDLSSNAFGGNGTIAIANAIEGGTPLHELDLSGNAIGDEGIVPLANAMTLNHVVAVLNLRETQVGLKGAEAIGKMLVRNLALVHLDLSKNNIRDDGAAAMADGIRGNSVLSWLDLGSNKIGEEGAMAVAEALGQSPRSALTELGFEGNRSPRRAVVQFRVALRTNQDRHDRKMAAIMKVEAAGNARPRDADVKDWLGGLGLSEYYDVFHENHLTYDVLPDLTAHDLDDIGITSVGARKKMLGSLPERHNEGSLPERHNEL